MRGTISVSYKASPEAKRETFEVKYDLTRLQLIQAVKAYVTMHFQTARRQGIIPPFVTEFKLKED